MRGLRTASLMGFVFLAAISASGQERGEVERSGLGWQERIEKTVESAAGGTLTVVSDRGGIEVTAWEQNQVQVTVIKKADSFTEAEARKLFEALEVRIASEGTGVQVTAAAAAGRRLRDLEVEVEVRVPARYSVDLKTAGGGIAVGDLGGNVKAETAGGGISVGQVTDGSVEVKTAGGGIEIKGIANGNGRAETAGGGISVGDVTGDLHAETSGGGISVGRVGGTLTVETAGGGIRIGQGGTTVEAETAGGGIEVGGGTGSVRAKTAGGGIRIGPTAGPVEAETAGGGIDIGEAGSSVRAETAGGGITVAGSGGPVVVETAGGGISIAKAKGYIEAKTSGGGIEAELVLADPAADTHCTLETAGGDVEIRLPAELAATVDAEIRVEGWHHRDYQIETDFGLKVEGQDTDRITAQGTLNGGGDLIRLRTVNGDIRIKRR
ncbi:MAG: DUF4097 family beta strand repeat-containing protein [Candidatus Latescibacterota bacterium]